MLPMTPASIAEKRVGGKTEGCCFGVCCSLWGDLVSFVSFFSRILF